MIPVALKQRRRLPRDLIAWALGRRRLFKVQGESMAPQLRPGDLVLVDLRTAARPGSIAVSRHPVKPGTTVIKRVLSRGEHTVWLGSDDPLVGTDSRHFGSVPDRLVYGPVRQIWRRHSPPNA
jgi:nickel-type superoxide dismutase maturation protease